MTNDNIIFITIGTSIYCISAFMVWLYLHFAYSKRGVNKYDKPNANAVVVVFGPVINTLFAAISWFSKWPLERKTTFNYNKFFLIK